MTESVIKNESITEQETKFTPQWFKPYCLQLDLFYLSVLFPFDLKPNLTNHMLKQDPQLFNFVKIPNP